MVDLIHDKAKRMQGPEMPVRRQLKSRSCHWPWHSHLETFTVQANVASREQGRSGSLYCCTSMGKVNVDQIFNIQTSVAPIEN